MPTFTDYTPRPSIQAEAQYNASKGNFGWFDQLHADVFGSTWSNWEYNGSLADTTPYVEPPKTQTTTSTTQNTAQNAWWNSLAQPTVTQPAVTQPAGTTVVSGAAQWQDIPGQAPPGDHPGWNGGFNLGDTTGGMPPPYYGVLFPEVDQVFQNNKPALIDAGYVVNADGSKSIDVTNIDPGTQNNIVNELLATDPVSNVVSTTPTGTQQNIEDYQNKQPGNVWQNDAAIQKEGDWVWYDHDNDPTTDDVFGPPPATDAGSDAGTDTGTDGGSDGGDAGGDTGGEDPRPPPPDDSGNWWWDDALRKWVWIFGGTDNGGGNDGGGGDGSTGGGSTGGDTTGGDSTGGGSTGGGGAGGGSTGGGTTGGSTGGGDDTGGQGGTDVPPIIIEPGNDDEGNNDEEDDVGAGDWLGDIFNDVSNEITTNLGGILEGGINIYGASEQADAIKYGADKAWNEIARQYNLTRDDLADERNIGDRAINEGLWGKTTRTLSPDARENLRTLNPNMTTGVAGTGMPEAFGGYDNLRDFEGQTGNWDYGQIAPGSPAYEQLMKDAVRMAENSSKARGRLNTQEARDSAFKSYVRAMGDVENLNASRLQQEMARRGYDRDTAAAERGQQAEEQLSSSQLAFAQNADNRDRLFRELLTEKQGTFANTLAANQQQMDTRAQYFQELLGVDAQEFEKLMRVAGMGADASARTGQIGASGWDSLASIAGANAGAKADYIGSVSDAFKDIIEGWK